jgi:hypothetical protein
MDAQAFDFDQGPKVLRHRLSAGAEKCYGLGFKDNLWRHSMTDSRYYRLVAHCAQSLSD